MKKKLLFIITLILLSVSAIFVNINAGTVDTITSRQRDTLLLMTARENPNYDLCLVIDISGSMAGVLKELKLKAERAIDYARQEDTIVLIKFDHETKKPQIKTIEKQEDRDEVKKWINDIQTTQGWGTDIKMAYFTTLSQLEKLNEERKKKKQPLRIQQVIFVSDGDNVYAADSKSPFKDPKSKENREYLELINKAQKQDLIQIIPVGMKFDGYRPELTRNYIPDATGKVDADLKNFDRQMARLTNRKPSGSATANDKKIPRKNYQPYINWLSSKVKLEKTSETKGEGKNTKVYNYVLSSDFKSVEISNVTANASFINKTGKLKGRITRTRVTTPDVKPGGRTQISVTVQFPQNWSFKEKKSTGALHLDVSGDMKVEVKEEVRPSPIPRPTSLSAIMTSTPTHSPTPSPTVSPKIKTRMVDYTYPFNSIMRDDPANVTISVEKSLFLYLGLGILAIIFFPLLLMYSILVPITVTLKMGEKAMAFRLANGGRISIGGGADFLVEGIGEPVAEIQRRFRRFILIELVNGTFPESQKQKGGKIPIKLGGGFSLNIAGEYKEFEFLPGNQEFTEEHEEYYEPDEDFADNDFKF
ncbi:MAG: VWA domain-containing protein [Candidatus Eremiobacteraeota bacterium]|nr:VWA domain-containing protein [Candidatus Eremiobacteraeota bacterium]